MEFFNSYVKFFLWFIWVGMILCGGFCVVVNVEYLVSNNVGVFFLVMWKWFKRYF